MTIAITVLGSTGTIGVNTLDVIARHPDRYRVFALTANQDAETLFSQCQAHRPQYAVLLDADAAATLEHRLQRSELADITVLSGMAGLEQVAAAADCDYVMAAIVGAAGLLPTLAAAKAGKRVLLANKEALVMAGQLLIDAARANNSLLLPIDSEHNAIWQCLPPLADHGDGLSAVDWQALGVARVLLTASGGPFRTTAVAELAHVTPDQACAHPNWKMGRKISVDSATMMNKGLELIEACYLFNLPPTAIDVVIHPESIIHSMVSYIDGSLLAQLGNPDMRTPIAHALAWPQRIASGVEPLDIFQVAKLHFERPQMDRYRCLALAYQAIGIGGTASSVLNAANEVAVAGFLRGDIRFTAIPDVVAACLESVSVQAADSLESILDSDRQARDFATRYISRQ